MTEVGGRVFFNAVNDIGVGYELWVSDGSAAGTYLVNDINPGSDDSWPGNFTDVDGRLFFTADDGVNDRELWISDGTEAGTVLVKDLSSHPDGSLRIETALVEIDGRLLFNPVDDRWGFRI